MLCLNSTSNSQVPTKLSGTASQIGRDRRSTLASASSTLTPASHRLPSASKRGRNATASCRSSRSIRTVISDPPFRLISRVKSILFFTGFPLASTNTSPGCSPASAAALPGATLAVVSRPTSTSWGNMKTMAKMTSGSRAFISEPAASTTMRSQGRREARLRGTVGLDSPASRTNPPKGITLTE